MFSFDQVKRFLEDFIRSKPVEFYLLGINKQNVKKRFLKSGDYTIDLE